MQHDDGPGGDSLYEFFGKGGLSAAVDSVDRDEGAIVRSAFRYPRGDRPENIDHNRVIVAAWPESIATPDCDLPSPKSSIPSRPSGAQDGAMATWGMCVLHRKRWFDGGQFIRIVSGSKESLSIPARRVVEEFAVSPPTQYAADDGE
ncbi:hypothetical protein [Nocardia colli]|uniref:hypothetical protein n=1 Tax=Nocardia colli TaxID=2545717 RepID=UPI0035E17237